MKLKKQMILVLAAIGFINSTAHAQSVTWTGPINSDSPLPNAVPFTLAGWMYSSMAQIFLDLQNHAGPGIPVNPQGGHTVTLGDASCAMEYPEQVPGQYVCQFSGQNLADGPFTRNFVLYLLKNNLTPEAGNTNSGTINVQVQPGQFQFVMHYHTGKVESIGCAYKLNQGEVAWAECSVQ